MSKNNQLMHPKAEYTVRLMIALDSIRSTYRWYDPLRSKNDALSRMDQLMSFITCCGWVYEAICVVRHGNTNDIISRELLHNNKTTCEIWDQVTAKHFDSLILMVIKIRDEMSSHFDPKCAKSFVNNYQYAKDIPAVSVQGMDEDVNTTFFHWSYHTLLLYIESKITHNNLVEFMEDVSEFIPKFIGLLDVLLLELYHEIELKGYQRYDQYYK